MLNYTTYHIYSYPPRKLRSATTASIYPIRTIGLACQIIDVSFIVLLCDSNHSALLDSLHAPTQPYTTTYQPYSTHRNLTRRSLLGRKFPLHSVVLTDWLPSFPFHHFGALSMLPICRIHHVNGLPTCRDCHYTSLGVCGRWRIRTSVPFLTAALAVRCFQPLSQPSLLSCLALFRKVFFRLLVAMA